MVINVYVVLVDTNCDDTGPHALTEEGFNLCNNEALDIKHRLED